MIVRGQLVHAGEGQSRWAEEIGSVKAPRQDDTQPLRGEESEQSALSQVVQRVLRQEEDLGFYCWFDGMPQGNIGQNGDVVWLRHFGKLVALLVTWRQMGERRGGCSAVTVPLAHIRALLREQGHAVNRMEGGHWAWVSMPGQVVASATIVV